MRTACRSRKGIGVAAALALCLTAMAASAQDRPVTSRQDRGDTVKINVSGRMTMDFVWRSSEMTVMTDNFSGGVPGTDGETTVEGEVGIRIDAELSDKVSAVVEIGKRRVDGTIDEFDGGGAESIDLLEAHVMIKEFLKPEIKAQLGISTWAFDVRGKGRSFAFDPRQSQTMARNWATTEDTLAGWASRGDDPNGLYPLGVWLSYSKDNLTIDVVALPVVIEGGNPSEDEALYALDFWYNLDSVGKGSRLGMIAAVSNLGALPVTGPPFKVRNHRTGVVTVGGGVVLNGLAEGIELYGEGYVQFGNAGQLPTATGEDEAKAKGRAGQIGLEYRLVGNANNIWFGGNLTYVSGDKDNQPDDENVNNFLSYENVRDLMILEDQLFGFDVDVNYTAFKVMAGISFSVGQGKNNIEIMAIAGFCKATQDVLLPSAEGEDKIGNEFDVTLKYILNRQVNLHAGFGYLAGSDLLEEAMGGAGNSESEDKAILGTFGFDVVF